MRKATSLQPRSIPASACRNFGGSTGRTEGLMAEQTLAADPALFDKLAAEIRRRVAEQGFMKHMGAEIEELRPGSCTVGVWRRPELLQQHGFFHGGVTAFLVDNATTVAAATMLQPQKRVLTAEYKLSFISPAIGERLVCRARVIKPGKLLSIVAADVFSRSGTDEKQTAAALATIAVVDAARCRDRREINRKRCLSYDSPGLNGGSSPSGTL